jgi:Cache 3/Cache 2 fusion domain
MRPIIPSLIAAPAAVRPRAKKARFVGMLILAVSFLATPMLMPSASFAQDATVAKSMAALKDQTAKLGAPKVEGNALSFGMTKINNDVVDAVVKANGGAASLFVKAGDEYVRVATTLKKEDGSSAVGTKLDSKGPVIAMINKGEAYYGDATLFGKPYVTGYEPIKDASGKVIGIYFVGYVK